MIASPTIQANFGGNLASLNTALQTPSPITGITNFKLGVGNTSSSTDGFYSADLSVTAGTPGAINLTAPLVDPQGYSLSVARVVGFMIRNKSTTTGQTLSLGGGTTPVFAALPSFLAIGPGGTFMFTTPMDGSATITAGTNNLLQVIASTGATIAYTIRIFTRSA